MTFDVMVKKREWQTITLDKVQDNPDKTIGLPEGYDCIALSLLNGN